MSKKKQILQGQISLTRMTHVIMEKKGKGGEKVRGLFIPIDINYLEEIKYTKNDGDEVKEVVIPVSVVINPETDDRGQDGFVGKNIPSKIYKEADDDEKERLRTSQPILGNLKDWNRSRDTAAPQVNDSGKGEVFDADDDDDLPF